MNTLKNFWITVGGVSIMAFSAPVMAQNYNLINSASNLKVEGTSNIHDWEITAKEMQGNLNAQIKDGQITTIDQLDFAVVAESLKSGKGGMDKNTYKALNTDKHRNVIYQLQKVNSIDCASKADCKVSTTGFLTIAGTKKPVEIVFDAKMNADNIVLTGSKRIKMTEFKVDPPTAMFGTITTGDEVNVKFQTTFTKD